MLGLADSELRSMRLPRTPMAQPAARLEAVMQAAVDGIIVIDVAGIVQSYNKACERLFGYAADEAYEQLTGVRLPDLGLPDQPAEPEGVYIDFENTAAVAERFPRLWERFG